MISTPFCTTLVFSAQLNFDHNNPNSFIENNITKVFIQALHDAKFLDHLAHYLHTLHILSEQPKPSHKS
jgi:hypothetical protein